MAAWQAAEYSNNAHKTESRSIPVWSESVIPYYQV
jgi:hypothetical protein